MRKRKEPSRDVQRWIDLGFSRDDAESQARDERKRMIARTRAAGATYAAIGRRLGISATRARQIVEEGKRRQRGILTEVRRECAAEGKLTESMGDYVKAWRRRMYPQWLEYIRLRKLFAYTHPLASRPE